MNIYIIQLLLGVTLYMINRYGEAIKMYDEVIRIDPTYAYAYYYKGWIYNIKLLIGNSL